MIFSSFFTVVMFPLYFAFMISLCCYSVTSYYNNRYDSQQNRSRLVWVDENGVVKVLLKWQIDLDRERIIFDLTAHTTGYVGFGLKRPPPKSNHGEDQLENNVADFDFVIGGIFPNGSSYLTDFHTKGNIAPIRDSSQDWNLQAAYQNATHTFLRFGRQFDTCDLRDDVSIHPGEQLKVIWALGNTDEINYREATEWVVLGNPLTIVPNQSKAKMLPATTPKMHNVSSYPSWKTIVNVTMKESFAYRCTFHRGPRLSTAVHAVAIKPVINDPKANKHVHHFSFYQCKIPNKVGSGDKQRNFSALEQFVADTEGNDCYTNDNTLPVYLCMQVLYVWCPGEEGMFFPEEAGYLITPDTQTYFMFEVHYENPGEIFNGVSFQVGVQLFYTNMLRKYNAGFLAVAHAVSDSLFIPPHSQNFKIEGRCTSNCTKRSLPHRGIDVISVMLHAHNYAKKLKLRHFRRNYELPWLAAENKYEFKSQKMKPVAGYRKILRGDSLVLECEYNTLSRNKVTTAGFSSTSEMCTAFLWYFPKINLEDCSSEFPVSVLKKFLKYENHNLSVHDVAAHHQNHNLTTSERTESVIPKFASYLDSTIKWTPALRNEVQEMLTLSKHHASCIIPGDSHNKPVSVAPPVFIYSDKVYRPRPPKIQKLQKRTCKN